MKEYHLLAVFAIICYLLLSVVGCRDQLNDLVSSHEEPSDTSPVALEPQVPTPVPEPPTFEDTLAKLQISYPDVLDAKFKTLQKVVNSKTYLAFFQHKYSLDEQVQTFDDLLASLPLPEERYMPFLEKHFEGPGELDIVGMHRWTIHARHLSAQLCNAVPEDIFPRFAAFSKAVDSDKQIADWLNFRFPNQLDPGVGEFLGKSIGLFTAQIEKEDQVKIKQQWDAYGKNEGLLRLALTDPFAIGYILNDFTDIDTFLLWVNDKCNEIGMP
jgi:hypothetical protein